MLQNKLSIEGVSGCWQGWELVEVRFAILRMVVREGDRDRLRDLKETDKDRDTGEREGNSSQAFTFAGSGGCQTHIQETLSGQEVQVDPVTN